MTSINASNTTLSPSAISQKRMASQANEIQGNNSAVISKSTTDKATFSGHALLLSRLFHTNDPNASPEVATAFTMNNLSGNSASFLTQADRKLMERAYDYAQSSGMDLEQVDNLAFDLANYRFLQVTGNNTEEIAGQSGIYDAEGNPWVGKYNSQDAEQVKRILTDPSVESTDIDKGFLAYLLNPQISGLTHAVSFAALVKFVPALTSQDNPSADNAAARTEQVFTPSDPGLAQALYRIDHPYQGAKWQTGASGQKNTTDQPWQHLSKTERKQIMEAYQLALLHSADGNLNLIEQMSRLSGIANMQRDPNTASTVLKQLLAETTAIDMRA
ncbi:hypothetical protein [Methylomonas albis]|uniref:Uncharacterized protein n=1 Tax=Methylomonas albis TaxID=1854563 RepID=A0ABR9CZB2_9GAMM|nr:hypothetical protein [Methylomonas albis]MBD9356221.1 hypothetical protein [Methylomonas albis]CAD6879288.1 hypothetical protein [Methylomonas albis]